MNLVTDLALILVVASIVTLLFKKLGQPLVLGYIVAGFLVSPNMPYLMSVVDKANIQTWADIGVIFLLFSLGLDFSFKKILKMGMAPVIAAISIIFSMMILGMGVGHAFGWSDMNCIFLAGMLAMSSTTIIYKAFDDMGLRQQRFASLVMSVLILEDILAIVMMVMLSTIAQGKNPDGGQMIGSIVKIGFFLVLWFVVGIFLIPQFLRSTRKLINDETMIVIAIGLCCLMAVISTRVGFSSAFGAFVMGSILAETIEADKIIRLVEPVKNLFGAVFFVSVGMLVDPKILVEYALPIITLVITILLGQSIFGSIGFMLSGQPLRTAMRCGFSMAQIGEFAFIIASLGLSLGVISDFLYPVVVAVSVITTFLTPYMIRAAEPAYQLLEKKMPKHWLRRLNRINGSHQTTDTERHHTDVHILPPHSTRYGAIVGKRLVGKCHLRTADRHIHLAIPQGYGHEKEPLRGIPSTMDRKQGKPPAAHLHHPTAYSHRSSIPVLHHQPPRTIQECRNHHHRCRGRGTHDHVAKP